MSPVMEEVIKGIVATIAIAGVTAPFIPFCTTLGINTSVWITNLIKREPKYKVGTKYHTLAAPSGLAYKNCYIVKTDFGKVYVQVVGGGVLPIKKKHFKKYQEEIEE